MNPQPTPNDQPHVADAVIADIIARKEMGMKKYGTPLQPLNGRRPLQDLYEELLDACHYLKQAMMEVDSIAELGKSFGSAESTFLGEEVFKQMKEFKKIAADRSEGKCSKTNDATPTPSTSEPGSTPKATEQVNLGPSISAGVTRDPGTASSNSLTVELKRRSLPDQVDYLTAKAMELLAERKELRAKLEAQSPPIAAWDEKRCREFVERFSCDDWDSLMFRPELLKARQDKYVAELASMPGGRVDGDTETDRVVSAFLSQLGDVIRRIGPARRPDDIKNSLEEIYNHFSNRASILSGRGADDSGWRPIETAPKTPSLDVSSRDYEFLAWEPDEHSSHGGDRRVCWWEPVMEKWWGDSDLEMHPTHWQPLPPGIVASGNPSK